MYYIRVIDRAGCEYNIQFTSLLKARRQFIAMLKAPLSKIPFEVLILEDENAPNAKEYDRWNR